MSAVLVVVVLEAECFLLEYLRQPNLEFFTFCQPIAPSALCNRGMRVKINMASTAEGVIAAAS